MATVEERGETAAGDGCRIAYTLHRAPNDDAPRIVLIHSLALDRSVWDGVVEQIGGRASVITYDCRGHGQSEHRPGTYTPELFARDLRSVLDHEHWDSAIIAGCSMGGCVAQAFAGLFPDRTDGLCLIDTTAWYGADAPRTWRERAAVAQKEGLAGLIDFQVTRWFGDQFRAEHPEKIAALKEVFLANDIACYVSTCEMLGDADLRHYLPRFKMPAAIVVGEEDYATPIAAAEQLNKAIAGSTLTVLPKARHITPVEAPDRIATEITAVMERAQPAIATS